jgi:hypothetical protein
MKDGFIAACSLRPFTAAAAAVMRKALYSTSTKSKDMRNLVAISCCCIQRRSRLVVRIVLLAEVDDQVGSGGGGETASKQLTKCVWNAAAAVNFHLAEQMTSTPGRGGPCRQAGKKENSQAGRLAGQQALQAGQNENESSLAAVEE